MKKNDRVRCIKLDGKITIGRVYTVEEHIDNWDNGRSIIRLRCDNGDLEMYYASYFELDQLPLNLPDWF